jgi:very-short-patch-repair endonuclease
VLGFDGVDPSVVEISVAGRRRAPMPGIVVHETSDLNASSVTAVAGIATTNATRTLLDLGSVVNDDVVEQALESALRSGSTSMARIRWELNRPRRGHHGAAALRRVLEARSEKGGPTESGLETVVATRLRKLGFPAPVRQYVIRDGDEFVARVDLAYPDARVVIEVDSYKWHSSREAWSRDRVREDRVTALGWRVIHATKSDADRGCARLAQDLRRLLGQQTFFGIPSEPPNKNRARRSSRPEERPARPSRRARTEKDGGPEGR